MLKIAAKIIGKDPSRWRLDAIGNIVFRPFNGCSGPLCYTYDHIIPYSKGGKTEVSNCQLLQTTLNEIKNEELDIIEKAGYGNIIINQLADQI